MIKEHLIDLEPDQLELLEQILKRHIPNKTVWAYGSRVTWKANERSDLDLVVFDCNSMDTGPLREALEESNLLVSVDVMKWESIPENFKKNIREKYVVLQEKIKLEDWQEVKLGEVVQLSNNPWKVGDENLPYIALEHIQENKLRITNIGNSDEVASNKHRFTSNNFLFGKLRPYFRKLYRPDFDGICSTDIWVVEPREGNDKDFLFYFFANQEFIDFSYSGATGTRMPRADWNFIKETKWSIPPLPEQKAIAEVLSSLDDKIDLLHRQNKTLEDMAQTLFRKWFVEDADEGWEVEELGNFVKVVDNRGKTPPNQSNKTPYPVIEVNALGDRLVNYSVIRKYVNEEVFNDWFRNSLKKYDTLVSTVGSIGFVSMFIIEIGNVAQNVIALQPTKISPFYLYQILKYKKEELLSLDIGGVQPSIKVPHLLEINIPIPPKEKVQLFDTQITNFVNKMEKNYQQIQTLEKLRDTLLPKLMSGSVQVENF